MGTVKSQGPTLNINIKPSQGSSIIQTLMIKGIAAETWVQEINATSFPAYISCILR